MQIRNSLAVKVVTMIKIEPPELNKFIKNIKITKKNWSESNRI